MKSRNFGVEIETIAPSKGVIVDAIYRVVGGEKKVDGVVDTKGRTWKVVYDGSLRGPGEGAEIVSPILKYDDLETVQEIVRSVRRAGAKVNETCGIHVHVGAETLSANALVNLIKIIYKQEKLIEAALGVHEQRKTYCRSIDPDFLTKLSAKRAWTHEDLNAAWYGYQNRHPTRYDSTRYRAINLHAVWQKGTVEFRWANATLHAGKVKAYVQFALALCEKAANQGSARAKQRDYNPASAKYDLRVFLLALGFIGEEFKTARQHLLERMPGSAAWKYGRPGARGTVA